MAQILQVYKQTFTIRYFEVEAFQFGLDNPEGIESEPSGLLSFWLQPIDPLLRN
jgi:hypothetical protein